MVNGIRLHTLRAIEGALLSPDRMHDREGVSLKQASEELSARIQEIMETAQMIIDHSKPLDHETEEFRTYIEKTASVPLPTDRQIADFATTLDGSERDCKSNRGQYFRGVHFFVAPGAGQESHMYRGEYCTRLSTDKNRIKRGDYLTRFGYIDYDNLMNDGKIDPKILGLAIDIELGKRFNGSELSALCERIDGGEIPDIVVRIPRELLRLTRLVEYDGTLDTSRRDTWIQQLREMIDVVRQGRERYC